ncbi:unnamed protein product, partial [Staurois parvus]
MALGRKGLTFGAIKVLTVCCFTNCAVCVLRCKHAGATQKEPYKSSMLVLT